MTAPAIVLTSDHLTANVSPFGAELVGLRHAEHGELLWRGDKQWWDRQSPLLFPVCGRSIGDQVRVGGKPYPMPLHGFAHSMDFEIAEQSADLARLTLSDNPASRAHYPFGFQLDVSYRLSGASLQIEAVATNTGQAPLPVSFGYHPGFVWPLPGANGRHGHRMVLDADSHLDVLRAEDGFMLADVATIRLPDRQLVLLDDLFETGALVMRNAASQAVRYEADGAVCAIGVAWTGLSRLLFWTKPGAPFICIEPWAGEPDPKGFSRELSERPGIEIVAPGGAQRYALTITIDTI